MKLAIGKGALSRALANVAKVIEPRNTIPILSHVRLVADGNTVTITGTDLDITASDKAEADIDVPGSLCVDAKLFTDIVRKVGDDISLNLDNDKLIVKAGRSRFSLATLPVEDFPDFPAREYATEFDVDLAALFAPCVHAISNEEMRYYLNGIYFLSDGETAVAVATDGHRLSKNTMTGLPEFAGIIVPRKLVGLLPKGGARIAVSDTRMRVSAGDMVMESKLIEGTFPDYERVIPKENPIAFEVGRDDMLRASDRVVTISSERCRGVKLEIAAGGVKLTAYSDVGVAEDEVATDYTGEPVVAGFNSAYLRDMLSVAAGDKVTFAVANDNGGPAVVTAPAMPDWKGVLMPLRVA